MGKGKELAQNTAILSVGKICTQLVNFLLMPLYTKLLTTQEYGVVDLVVTYGQLLLPVVTMQMEQGLFRFLIEHRTDDNNKKKIISEIMSLTFLITIIFSLIYIIISPFIKSEFKFYLLINLWANVFSAMLLQAERGIGENMTYAIGSFVLASGQVILNIIFVAILKMGVRGMMLAMICAYILSGIFILFKIQLCKYFKPCIPKKGDIAIYLKYSAPLVPNAISWWILGASDRSVILKFLGVGFNGIYSAASKFSGIYTTIYNIFNMSWTELVSLHMKDSNSKESFNELQSTVVRLCITIALGLVAVMPFAFKILVNEKFADAYYQIPILTIGVFFSSMVGLISAYYIADKKTAIIARTSMMCAAINIILNISMISKIGLYAASISTVVAYFSLYCLRYRDVKKRFGIKLETSLIISATIMMLFIGICYYIRNMILCAVAFLIYIGYAVALNIHILKNIVDMVKIRRFKYEK